MKSRFVILFVGFLCMWGILFIKTMSIQVLPNEKLESLQNRLYKKRIVLKPRRGAILDRNGLELAASIPSHSLYADPAIIKDPYGTAKTVAKILRQPWRPIYKKIKNKKRRFVWLKRHVDESHKKKIAKLKRRGLAFVEEPKRIYPNGRLLNQVLGIVGREGKGLEGVELVKEETLSGAPKSVAMNKDARGRPLLLNGRIFTDSPDGTDIQLTIDAQLQYQLEQELTRSVAKHKADSAVGVILEVKSGEVLAMANVPTSKPKGSKSYHYWRRNRAITDSFEPGSTFKPIVVTAALEEGLAKPNTKFFCENGRYKIGDRYITESDSNHNYGWLSTSDVLAYSSNIGTTKIAQKVGAKTFYKYIKKFGFGDKTDVTFPGESKGILHKTPWNPHLLSNISFGHGITTTPLQIAAAFNTYANGGIWKKPILFKAEKKEERRIISEETARLMRLMLMASTSEKSTGANARVPGYLVAGKTGTAQKVDPSGRGYLKGVYISSFAGFAPANDPKYVIYIAVDHPREEGYYGSQVAAPIFSRIAKRALRQSGLQPLLISQKDLIIEREKDTSKVGQAKVRAVDLGVVPELSGLSLREALERVEGSNLKIDIRGSGYVKSTYPKSGQPLKDKSRLKIILE